MNQTRYVLGIDPGNTLTGFILIDTGDNNRPLQFGKIANTALIHNLRNITDVCRRAGFDKEELSVGIEFPFPRGQLGSIELFQTIEWCGRFMETLERQSVKPVKINRMHVKQHMVGNAKAKDSQIRAAVISVYGGEAALTGGKCPDCKGKGNLGKTPRFADCDGCGATGQVAGAKEGKTKKCPKCGGSAVMRVIDVAPCPRCNSTGQVQAGVLKGVSADVWQALGLALTFAQYHEYKDARNS
jgi:Holliday junction resolvasome RuvABC endonuclease subunit